MIAINNSVNRKKHMKIKKEKRHNTTKLLIMQRQNSVKYKRERDNDCFSIDNIKAIIILFSLSFSLLILRGR